MALNNHMHSDSKKRRSYLALLFAAGDVKRSTRIVGWEEDILFGPVFDF